MLRTHLAALWLAATALAVGGCGGSSKSSTTSSAAATTTSSATTATATTPTTTATTSASSAPLPSVTVQVASGRPLTRAQWIAKGDAVCARLFQELEAITVKTMTELPRVLPQEAAYERTAVAELAKLVPPASKATDWQRYLNGSLQVAEGSAKLAEYGKLGDAITRLPLARMLVQARLHAFGIAQRDGFKWCARA